MPIKKIFTQSSSWTLAPLLNMMKPIKCSFQRKLIICHLNSFDIYFKSTDLEEKTILALHKALWSQKTMWNLFRQQHRLTFIPWVSSFTRLPQAIRLRWSYQSSSSARQLKMKSTLRILNLDFKRTGQSAWSMSAWRSSTKKDLGNTCKASSRRVRTPTDFTAIQSSSRCSRTCSRPTRRTDRA